MLNLSACYCGHDEQGSNTALEHGKFYYLTSAEFSSTDGQPVLRITVSERDLQEEVILTYNSMEDFFSSWRLEYTTSNKPNSILIRMSDMLLQSLLTGEIYLSEVTVMDDEVSGNIVIRVSNEKFPSGVIYSNVMDFKREWKFLPLSNNEQEGNNEY